MRDRRYSMADPPDSGHAEAIRRQKTAAVPVDVSEATLPTALRFRMCPECSSDKVTIDDEYDFGVCAQTGYHDAGERFRCRACRAQGDAGDLVVAQYVESDASFVAETSAR